MKKTLKTLCIIAGAIVALPVLFIAFLTVAEYRPEKTEAAVFISQNGGLKPAQGETLTVVTWNIGYASLDAEQDFFMDGGKRVRPETDSYVKANLAGIRDYIADAGADAVLIQEADRRSYRSYYVNQAEALAGSFGGTAAFAPNFRCVFVPFPVPRFIGPVDSGLLTMSRFAAAGAERFALTVPFKWPVRIANLKRCLLVERIPVEGAGADLVLVNLHLEAYDDGGGREAQTRELMELLYREYRQGNYVIAGGDFNQNFPDIDEELYALKDTAYFKPGVLSPSDLEPLWRFAFDPLVPTSRLLNKPYSGDYGDSQLYAIDGFLVSPNVEIIDVRTEDAQFRYSDHNPVILKAALR
ncbi:MAG: endonuclease/exonuclease/phosphatase family protein [Spirochaetaceae bacterium]|jgi:endonuclease/exonuclease/phosphatase family metal-dependent hydrolase|nr:endonuclease/exonuclease/phosphatase family protein [Spirochaetaceae bacterium]